MTSEDKNSVMTDEEMISDETRGRQMERLRAIVSRLRGPGGCPWDAEQTHQTLITNLIEETYEVVDAIRSEDYEHLREELGDLLLQVVFHAQLAEEAERYDLEDVAQVISEKLVRRHPHVFGEVTDLSTDGVLTQWEEIKRKEKGESLDLPYLHKVGEGLPALLASRKLQKKAAKVGFDWEDAEGVLEKVKEELSEVEEELQKGSETALEEEVGDLLFSVVNLARKLDKDPELLLHEANKKFQTRFTRMEQNLKRDGKDLKSSTLDEMEAQWQSAKEEAG